MPTPTCDRCNMAWGELHNCFPPAQLVAAEARLAAAEALTVEWEANVRERAPDDLYAFGMARCRRDLVRVLDAARPDAPEEPT